MHQDKTIEKILAVRQFNRFYTKEFGFLQKRILHTDFALVEARVIYEIANREIPKANEIAAVLDLDAGYLSRILKKFEENGWVERKKCAVDGRSQILSLTDSGQFEAAQLADIANTDIAAKFDKLGEQDLHKVVDAMKIIETTLDETQQNRPTPIIRSHRPGDIGWVISSQGKFYAEEYGFNENFEALVAQIGADFLKKNDPRFEHCWIAEIDGKSVGTVMLVRVDASTAKLRLFFVDGEARGYGLGTKLVDECVSFAKRAGYERVVLYTNACLGAARRIYERAGFHLVNEAEHSNFGAPQTEQDWVLEF
jgi:DNA-binding MarR family transcriptional regulator/GNAT superfamily N-acetyltransferase